MFESLFVAAAFGAGPVPAAPELLAQPWSNAGYPSGARPTPFVRLMDLSGQTEDAARTEASLARATAGDGAVRRCETAARRHPDSRYHTLALGYSLAGTGRWAEAETVLARVMPLDQVWARFDKMRGEMFWTGEGISTTERAAAEHVLRLYDRWHQAARGRSPAGGPVSRGTFTGP